MAEGHVFFVEKGTDEDGVVDTDMVWQDTYTEIVAYEENIEDNSQLNVVYVTDDNISTNEHYVSAVEEDSSQYYSVMETSGDTSVVEQPDETPKIEECVNTSEITLTDEPNISVIEYPSETIVPDDSVNTEHVNVNSDKVESEVVENVEDDDQVTLYKIEDSNELFAVQIARDADGKIHKYQYKVRQNEDGQLEAVPGTIQIQPEGTEQLICEEQENKECVAEEQFTEEPLTEAGEPSLEELNNCKTEDTDNELKPQITEEIIPEVTEEVSSSTLFENQVSAAAEMEIESHYEEEVVDESNKQGNIENNVEYLKEEDEQDIPVEQITEETYYDENGELEEFTNVEYLQEDFEDEEENQQNFENLENIVEKNKENTVEENVEHSIEQSLVVQKKYAEGSQVQVISDVVLNENHENNNANAMKQKQFVINNNTSSKHILNKITDLTFLNENIELKQISNPIANKNNKLTFLIVTQPVITPQPEQQKPTIPIQRTTPIHPSKKFRSILRQSIPATKTHTQFSKNNTFVKNDRDKSEHSTSQNAKVLLFNNVINKPMSQTPLYNKGVRQPRKQVITPVNRVGSEIIIQVPEEKQMTVETLDLDDISDTDYSPKCKTKIKKVYHKKRGRKPAWTKPSEIATTENDDTSKSNVENDAETIKKDKPSIESKEEPQTTQETQEPEQATTVKPETQADKPPPQPKYTLPPKKRGPGRPKLSERKHNFIEQQIIEHAKTENGTPNSLRKRGRPKLIRTQRKYTNLKPTSSSKVSESKENKESPSKIPDGENITPRRRGRPPKKRLTPTVVNPKKEDTTKITNETTKSEISKNVFSSDSETEIKPTVKKPKIDSVIDKQMDSIINEMEGIHGGSCDDEDVPMIEEHLESDVDDDDNDKKETLLSILETPNESSAAPVTVNVPDKEDVLTRALKDANILIQSDDGDEMVGGAVGNAQVPFLEPVKPKDDEYDKNLLKSSSSAEEKKDVVETKSNTDTKSIDVKKMSQIYKCVKCSKTFSKYIDLKTHMQDHNLLIKGKFKCNKCPQIFTLESALRIHERNHLVKESGSSGDAKTSKSETGRFKCIQCSRSFSTVSLLRAHQQTHKNFKCDRCTELFHTRNQLLMHIRGHIKDNLLKTSNFSRKLRKSTQDKTEFSEIIRNVEKDLKPRKTLTSPATANNKGRINSDLTLPNIHRCNVCSKTFRQLAHLVMHREVHNKPTCVNCGKVFSFKHSLNEHMRRYCLKSSTPKNRKSYEIKRKSFNTQDTNNRFKRQTSHGEPANITYKCKHCDKIFRSQLFCNKHMKTHDEIKSKTEQTLNNNYGKNNEPIIKKCYIPLVMTNLTSRYVQQKTSSNQTNTKVSQQTTKRATICSSTVAPISERRQSDRKQVPSKKVMPIRCEMCNLSFTTYTGLFRHTRTHPG